VMVICHNRIKLFSYVRFLSLVNYHLLLRHPPIILITYP